MERIYVLIAGLVLSATPVAAEQITIETNDNAMFIRCVDQYGFAQCEMIFESKDEYYDCIAFDGDGKPLATGTGQGGSVIFAELDATLVADVKCR